MLQLISLKNFCDKMAFEMKQQMMPRDILRILSNKLRKCMTEDIFKNSEKKLVGELLRKVNVIKTRQREYMLTHILYTYNVYEVDAPKQKWHIQQRAKNQITQKRLRYPITWKFNNSKELIDKYSGCVANSGGIVYIELMNRIFFYLKNDCGFAMKTVVEYKLALEIYMMILKNNAVAKQLK